MGNAYTPGLTVTPRTTVRKTRRLPLKGTVLVAVGDRVAAGEVVARTELPGKVLSVNVANLIAAAADEVPELCTRREGQAIAKGELLAQSRGLLGFFKQAVYAPVSGIVESISKVTGQVLLREAPIPVEVSAYVNGRVVEVIAQEGVVVEAEAALVQGIFGLGGEVHAPIRVVARAPDEVLDADRITPELRGALVLGGRLLTLAGARRAAEVGVAGVVTGGFHYDDVRELLGRDLGVAITGTEKIGTTIVLTEGFGEIAMARVTYELLASHAGCAASASGATQIRAGVIRPEVIVALEGGAAEAAARAAAAAPPAGLGLDVGAPVRGIRHPHFGKIGRVAALPVELALMPSGSRVRVIEVDFEDGARALLPRANVEVIERR